ncbi:LamG domain-containing protein [Candidatus Poribacteria bacterium]|nr:LamG domain-containing protein [Candidatus Poribacteria bacterium]
MKFYIFFLLLGLILAVALIDVYAVDPDLVVYLPLDEDKGEEVVDASGNGHNAAIVGNFKWIDGKYGKAVELVAAGAEVQVPDDKAIDGMKALTVEVWVKQDTHQATGIVQKGANWPDISYLLQPWSDQQIYFGVKDTSSRAITKPGDYPLKEWYHLAGTYDGSTLKIYINGKEKASAPAPVKAVPDTTQPLQVGNRLLGAIDEFVLYTRALSADEIQDDMNGKLLPVTTKGKLATCWGRIKGLNIEDYYNLYFDLGKLK